ncbi:decaprenyl-phosphate phosphoribosyltransferase [Phytohabitans rumicis]|uniref:Decaprenyl-phosphate phosphoribosyltransferase n=1 Tax=Phytohabitans rumicis TaxID=1076125 RepID=A0A6V8LLP6_9ACTN|nr:decaprenyl-phosphate phosphoribosyltransferase [Phytohabitans rumicis]GFJ95549.1 decaprenyl-phosphate phosphoribosyltransferase [Phytohabitans rumicis]
MTNRVDGAPTTGASDRPGTAPAAARRASVLIGLVGMARLRQWGRNVLVAGAALASGEILRPEVFGAVVVGFAAFCLTASGVYFVNDILDATIDRNHPAKHLRPVAARLVPVPLAGVVGAGLLVAGLAVGAVLGGLGFAALLATYVVLMVLYSLHLKHQPLVDIATIAAGYVLRAFAGGVIAGVPMSPWFLVVAASGSLLVAAGKRYSEVVQVGEGAAAARPVLARYSPSYLRFLWGTAAAVTIMGYVLWAFDAQRQGTWAAVSAAPFALAVLRYVSFIDLGAADSPEAAVLRDRSLQLWLVVWSTSLLLVVAG